MEVTLEHASVPPGAERCVGMLMALAQGRFCARALTDVQEMAIASGGDLLVKRINADIRGQRDTRLLFLQHLQRSVAEPCSANPVYLDGFRQPCTHERKRVPNASMARLSLDDDGGSADAPTPEEHAALPPALQERIEREQARALFEVLADLDAFEAAGDSSVLAGITPEYWGRASAALAPALRRLGLPPLGEMAGAAAALSLDAQLSGTRAETAARLFPEATLYVTTPALLTPNPHVRYYGFLECMSDRLRDRLAARWRAWQPPTPSTADAESVLRLAAMVEATTLTTGAMAEAGALEAEAQAVGVDLYE